MHAFVCVLYCFIINLWQRSTGAVWNGSVGRHNFKIFIKTDSYTFYIHLKEKKSHGNRQRVKKMKHNEKSVHAWWWELLVHRFTCIFVLLLFNTILIHLLVFFFFLNLFHCFQIFRLLLPSINFINIGSKMYAN